VHIFAYTIVMNDPSPFPQPVPPAEPEPWECCGSGCEPCVYDRYWQQLERYEEALERWRRCAATAEDPPKTRDTASGTRIDKP
jgi:hypothetical protein